MQDFPDISNKQYQSLKRALLRKEANNNNRIYLIPCSGNKGWYEMGERSALFFYYEIVGRFGLKHRFHEDNLSFHNHYKIGYIRTQNLDDIRNWLKKAKLYATESYDDQHIFYFELNHIFTESEIRHFEDKENKRRLDAMSISPAHNLSPEFYQLLINISYRIHHALNNQLDRLTCLTTGTSIITLLDNTLEYYHHLTFYKPSAHNKIISKWQAIHDNLFYTVIKFKVLSDTKMLKSEVCVSIIEVLNHLIKIAHQEIINAKSNLKSSSKENKNA